jgi:hypothetical protein
MQDLGTEVQKQRKDAAGKGHQPLWGLVLVAGYLRAQTEHDSGVIDRPAAVHR